MPRHVHCLLPASVTTALGAAGALDPAANVAAHAAAHAANPIATLAMPSRVSTLSSEALAACIDAARAGRLRAVESSTALAAATATAGWP